jgi:TonB family protein
MAQQLGLTADQVKKMDDVFQQARLKLIDLNAVLQKEELIMEPLIAAEQPDEAKIVAQIDKVAQARAELEKANARMLLGIRRVLTAEQWQKLKAGTANVNYEGYSAPRIVPLGAGQLLTPREGSTAAYNVGNGVAPPVVILKVEPQYTEEARRAKLAGTVVLGVVVDPDGVARTMYVQHALGMGLDQKAMEAVQRWRFRPGMKDGKPVAVQATVEVNFRPL